MKLTGEKDRGSIFDWHRCWFGFMRCTPLHPRAFSHQAERTNGRVKVCIPNSPHMSCILPFLEVSL